MMFDGYLMVDWSASNVPNKGENSIWLWFKHPRGEISENPSTRVAAYRLVRELLLEHSGLRILVGMDFPYGYPAGLADRLGVCGWIGIWNEWHNRITDAENNSNNRFRVAAELNRVISGSASPFWGCHKAAADDFLNTKKGSLAGLPEYRLCEPKTAHSVWQLFTSGNVGSQALMGIPYLYKLRFDEQLRSESCVWPFESGMRAPEPDKRVVHAEIYPSLFPIEKEGEEVMDKAQVRTLARRFHELDREGKLSDYFTGPELTTDQHDQARSEEGWVLGVMAASQRQSVKNMRVQEPAAPYRVLLPAYSHRIETLRRDAEIERFSVNEDSETDFWRFIGSVPAAKQAELVLMDNGNLRAVWKDKNGDHLGVQFLGERMAEYVIFKHRPDAARVSRVAGVDTLEAVLTQLHTFDLDLETLAAA